MPKLAYYLASTDNPIGSDHPLWRSALPEGRLTGKSRPSASAITYEDYFGAVAAFCLSNHAARLRQAATACLERPVDGEALGDISIFLEKHGAFYHLHAFASVFPVKRSPSSSTWLSRHRVKRPCPGKYRPSVG
ncbi:hypothetical protein [Desulfosarcina cetonica]|uniref:hypothetical protein n=1 Tax=Desulfosarcina cetonica TaxID=90730 RepID=UPI0012EDA4BB|nr:hypothetical protein [Desulfosarcina cetonica]